MAKYVAFLRAINVGGRNVKMGQLRRIFEAIGLANVETFIASGNVLFEARSKSTDALEKNIAAALQDSLGYPVKTFVRSDAEIGAIVGHEPFNAGKSTVGGIYVVFLPCPIAEEIRLKLLSLQTETDKFNFHRREIFWRCLTNFSDSGFAGPRLEKTLGVLITVRSATTVRKIAAKIPRASS
ncbi:MAG: DUF1697 domain-containing protein [Chthoniobacterales bacterium]